MDDMLNSRSGAAAANDAAATRTFDAIVTPAPDMVRGATEIIGSMY